MCPRRNYKKYEEVRVPAVKTGGLAADEQLVKVSDMEEWAQLAFEGYKCAPLPTRWPTGGGDDEAVGGPAMSVPGHKRCVPDSQARAEHHLRWTTAISIRADTDCAHVRRARR